MPHSGPLVRTRILSAFESLVAARGVDPVVILREVGLDTEDLADPDNFISLNTVAEMFEFGARRTGDPAFGVHYAESFPKGGSGILGHIMLSAPTVGASLEAVVRYLELLMQPMHPELAVDIDASTYSLQMTPAPTRCR